MAWNLNITNLPENEYPLLTAYKGSFDNMAQLNMTYPKSKVNSFAFIEDMNTFVVWSVALQDWQYIQHDGGLPLFTANFLIDFNTVAHHGMFSIVGNSPGLFQSTNTGEGIMYQMVMWKNKVYTRTIDLTANPIVYPEFVSDTDKIAEIIHENLNGTNYLMVYGVGTPSENAAELQAAYDAAKNMPRYLGVLNVGNPINVKKGQTFMGSEMELYLVLEDYTGLLINSAGEIGSLIGIPQEEYAKAVRTTIVVAPGDYTFGTTKFAVNANGIDIVSLTGNADVKLDGIRVTTANNIYLKGLNCGTNMFAVYENLIDVLFEKCKGGDYSFGAHNLFQNVCIDCVGGINSFGGGGGEFAGKAINCTGGDDSFGGDGGSVSGTAINCTGGGLSFAGTDGTITGKIINCTGGGGSFGGNAGSITGRLEYCKLLNGEFHTPELAGKIINCINGDGSVYNSVNHKITETLTAGTVQVDKFYAQIMGANDFDIQDGIGSLFKINGVTRSVALNNPTLSGITTAGQVNLDTLNANKFYAQIAGANDFDIQDGIGSLFKINGVTGIVEIRNTILFGTVSMPISTSAPASATATGTAGEIRVTASAIYACIATNTWVKADLATW